MKTRLLFAFTLVLALTWAATEHPLSDWINWKAFAQQGSGDNSPPPQFSPPIPGWIRNNTVLWSHYQLDDSQFILGIRYLVANDIMPLPHEYSNMSLEKPIPTWFRTVGTWWSEGAISDYDFIASLQYLITSGDIKLGPVGRETAAQDSALLQNNFQGGRLMLDGTDLDVQVAQTQDQMVEGLQFQQPLPYNQGMIFVFDEPQVVAMWMKDMQFPLDMIWFDSNGNVVHIEKNLPPCTETAPCQVYDGGKQATKYVLEVTSGFVDKFNVTEKSKITMLKVP